MRPGGAEEREAPIGKSQFQKTRVVRIRALHQASIGALHQALTEAPIDMDLYIYIYYMSPRGPPPRPLKTHKKNIF